MEWEGSFGLLEEEEEGLVLLVSDWAELLV